MSWVMVAAGTVTAGTAAYKGIAGARQAKKGRELERNNIRPTYTRPGEVTESLNLAERNFRNGMPGLDEAKSVIGTNTATALDTVREGATTSADVLDGATKVNMNANNANNNLNVQEQNFRNSAMNNYIAQLMNNATYSDKEFDYNQNQPFQETAAKAAALIGAGNQNINNAIGEIGGAANAVLMTGAGGGTGVGGVNPISGVSPTTGTQSQNLISGLGIDGRKLVYDPSTKTFRYQ